MAIDHYIQNFCGSKKLWIFLQSLIRTNSLPTRSMIRTVNSRYDPIGESKYKITPIDPEENDTSFIRILFLNTLEVTRGRWRTHLNLKDAEEYIKWFEAYETLSSTREKRRHVKKNCPKNIRHLRLCSQAYRNLYWKCYWFQRWKKTEKRRKRLERFADSWALEQILSDMETRLWSGLEDRKFQKEFRRNRCKTTSSDMEISLWSRLKDRKFQKEFRWKRWNPDKILEAGVLNGSQQISLRGGSTKPPPCKVIDLDKYRTFRKLKSFRGAIS